MENLTGQPNVNDIIDTTSQEVHEANRKAKNGKIKELDVVELTKELPQMPQGTQGTVVFVYPGGAEVEVEFVDQEGNTRSVEKVSVEFLRKVKV
jgi:hypothetical protein